MSATSCLLSEDQFLCSICLDVFTDPVSTPCGHNFCKGCITKHWEISLTCQCPNCKMAFNPKPKLHVNTFISEMVALFTQAAQRAASREPLLVQRGNLSEPGEVPCDACIGTKRRALKSCLECLVSYCEAHLEPHLKLSRLKRHQLIDPVKEVLERKKAELMKTEADLQQQIVEKQMDIQEIEDSLETSRRNADRAIKTGDQVFTRMKEAIEMKQAKAVKIIEEHRKTANEQAAGLIRDLRVEILSLQKRRTKLVQLMQSGDDLSLLKYEEAGPSSRSCQRTTFSPPHYGMIVRKAVTLFIQDLNKGRELETIQLQFPSA